MFPGEYVRDGYILDIIVAIVKAKRIWLRPRFLCFFPLSLVCSLIIKLMELVLLLCGISSSLLFPLFSMFPTRTFWTRLCVLLPCYILYMWIGCIIGILVAL